MIGGCEIPVKTKVMLGRDPKHWDGIDFDFKGNNFE